MERVGSKEPNKIRAFVDDALQEIGGLIPEKTTYEFIDVEDGTKLYSLPSNMVKLLGVYRKYREDSDGNYTYVKIGRISHLDLTEAASSTAADGEDDIIVI